MVGRELGPLRTGAQTGATLVASAIVALIALGALAAAVYAKIADVNFFGRVSNLLLFAIALLLLASFLLLWEIVVRLASRWN